jgi:hypothetical protein
MRILLLELCIDPDVKTVAEFMQSKFAAARLVSIAKAISELAPLFWGKYSTESVDALYLAHPQPSPITENGLLLRDANELAPRMGVDGDPGEARGADGRIRR